MYFSNLLVFALALVGAQSRYLAEDIVLVPTFISRIRRDVQGDSIGSANQDSIKLRAATGGAAIDNIETFGTPLDIAHTDVFDQNDFLLRSQMKLFSNQITSFNINTDYETFDMPGIN